MGIYDENSGARQIVTLHSQSSHITANGDLAEWKFNIPSNVVFKKALLRMTQFRLGNVTPIQGTLNSQYFVIKVSGLNSSTHFLQSAGNSTKIINNVLGYASTSALFQIFSDQMDGFTVTNDIAGKDITITICKDDGSTIVKGSDLVYNGNIDAYFTVTMKLYILE